MEENLTEEGKMRKAYLLGLKWKKAGLNEDIIYARLEKQGFSVKLAREVASNVILEGKKVQIESEKVNYNIALLKVGLGVLLAIGSKFIFPGIIILPIGLIVSGVLYAILSNDKINNLK